MNIRDSVAVPAIAVSVLLLSSCGNKHKNSVMPGTAEVTGAREALEAILPIGRSLPSVVRPAALLGIYVNLFMTESAAPPVHAALDGIAAQGRIHGQITRESVDNLYELLEEFGAVLHVNIADLMNRSSDRADTLDAYSTGLGNITERSRRRSADIKEQISSLKKTQSEQKRAVARINKEITNAVKSKDFQTAHASQKALTDAQTELTSTELTLKEMVFLQQTFAELDDVAKKRIAALDQNREVLIAGLRVVDVPGVEDLGVLERKAKKRGGRSIFGE